MIEFSVFHFPFSILVRLSACPLVRLSTGPPVRLSASLQFLIPLHQNFDRMKIRIVSHSRHALPAYETGASAGMDLRAMLDAPILLKPLERALIPTGLFVEIPVGYEAQIRPRSGLAIKKGITVLNAPGTIDADYRGEVKVILVNLSNEDFTVTDGERVAQMIVAAHETVEWEQAEELAETTRGTGGFGHTGAR